MEHEKSTENQILSGKLGKYEYSDKKYDNFVCPGEITVQITLDEYRRLVMADAMTKQKISEAEHKWYAAERERDALKKENAELKEKVVRLAGSKADEGEKNDKGKIRSSYKRAGRL